jgi:hypothetical protein
VIDRKESAVPAADDYRYNSADGPRDRSLRVGDRERDSVGEVLRQGHLEGRLDTDELQSRLERCIAAKSYAQLDELIADFPPEAEARERPAPRSWNPSRLAFPLLPVALIAAIVVGAHVAWLAVPLFFLFVVRARSWGGGYGRGPGACGPRRLSRV